MTYVSQMAYICIELTVEFADEQFLWAKFCTLFNQPLNTAINYNYNNTIIEGMEL